MKRPVFCAFVFFCVLAACCGVPIIKGRRNARGVRQVNNDVFRNDCNCVCGISNRHMRVVGGNVTKIHEFPWLAGLYKAGEYFCGATLITRRHLLTAAHCIEGFDLTQISAVLADHDRDAANRLSTIVVRNLVKARTHKRFEPYTFNNDIAVVELDAPVQLDAKIQTACLPYSESGDYAGRSAVVAGWGKLGERLETSSVLRKVVVPIWTKEACYASGYGRKKLTENMFCAGYPEGKIDACQGDSGGPLVMKTDNGHMDVVGIVSWGRGCARPNLPGIYTKITNYLDWIRESLGGECMCPPPPSGASAKYF